MMIMMIIQIIMKFKMNGRFLTIVLFSDILAWEKIDY